MILYRFLISLFSVAVLIKSYRTGGLSLVNARLGAAPQSEGRRVWVHAASLGEWASFRPVLELMAAQRPDIHWIATANTATGQRLVESWGLNNVTVCPAPIDLGWATRRFYRRSGAAALVTLESEYWPHRFLNCPGPVILVGARLSKGTLKVWSVLLALAKRVFGRVQFASAQDSESQGNLLNIGLRENAMAPVFDLKSLYEMPVASPDEALRETFNRSETWLAASTHDGEDELLLLAHKELLELSPKTKLILAPRHPERAEHIHELALGIDLTVSRRSLGDVPDTQVYIADTLGEMALWYQLAGRVFIGGTLVDRGGHTPYEPAAFGCAILHGPDTQNFRSSFGQLDGLAKVIQSQQDLTTALTDLAVAEKQREIGAKTRDKLKSTLSAQQMADALLAALAKTRNS